jgi:hypothetical protein
MIRKKRIGKPAWIGLATVIAAAMLVPAALADKPASKSKPIAAEKTWVKVGGGKGYGTYLKLDAAFATALKGLGIAAAPLTPASDPGDSPDMGIRFPITQGKLILSSDQTTKAVNGVRGTVGHVGGLSLKKGDVTVRVRNLIIVANVVTAAAVTTDTSKLTAQVNGKRIDFATLKLTLPPTIVGKTVTVGATDVKLTAAAAAALNKAFGTTLDAATAPAVGTATMKARLVGKGKA